MHSIGNVIEQDLKKQKRRNYPCKNSEIDARKLAMKRKHIFVLQYGSLGVVPITPPLHTQVLISLQYSIQNKKESRTNANIESKSINNAKIQIIGKALCPNPSSTYT
jgi:hypothetical protein